MARASHAALLLAAFGLFASLLGAQTYTRTQTTAAYVQRSGTPATATRVGVGGGLNDVAWQFALPFNFQYFDRTYRQVLVTLDGSVYFAAPTGFLTPTIVPLTAPVGQPSVHEAIHLLHSDLVGHELVANVGIYVETGRVVIQWRDVASDTNAGAYHLNFQCHLLETGDIEMRYGPEVVGFDQDLSYVSGIVDAAGTASFAGFNNSLLVQTTRPTANDLVTLVPSGFTQLNGVEVAVRQNGQPAESEFRGVGNGRVVGSFTLTPRGAGGTVSSIGVRHFAATAGENLQLSIYRDNGSLGHLDAADVPLAGGSQSMLAVTVNTFVVSEPVLTQAVRYLLVVDVITILSYYRRDFNSSHFSIETGGVICSSNAWGSYFTEQHEFAPANVVFASVSVADRGLPIARPGQESPLLSFELRNNRDFGNGIVTGFDLTLTLAGPAITDIAEVAIYRDLGQRGIVDGADFFIDAIASPATTSLTLLASEWISNNGSDYLVTVTMRAASVAEGRVAASLTGLDFSVAGGVVSFLTAPNGPQVLATQTGTTLLVRRRHDDSLSVLPVGANQVNLPALAFNLITSYSSTAVTSMIFRGDTNGMSAARLYTDAGTVAGRFDAGDTQVGGTPVIVAGAPGTITFTFATPLAVNAGGSDLLLIVDFTAATPASSHVISLNPVDVTCVVTVAGEIAIGCLLQVQAGSATGVNVTGLELTPNIALNSGDVAVLGRVQLTARGVGGDAPALTLDFIDAAGGVGHNSGFWLYMYLEGAGPLGVLDASDLLLNGNDIRPLSLSGQVALLKVGNPVSVGAPRNILLVIRRDKWQTSGVVTVVFRGFFGGTDVQIPTLPDALRTLLVATTSDPVPPADDEFRPGHLEPSCTTGEGAGWWLALLAALAVSRVAWTSRSKSRGR